MPAPELQEFFAKTKGGDEGAVEAMLQDAAQPGGCRGAHRARGQGVRLW